AAAQAIAAIGAQASGPANGLVVIHRAIADGQSLPKQVGEAAALAIAAAGASLAADGLVVDDRAVAHRSRGPDVIIQATTDSPAREGACIACASDGLVVAEHQVAGGQGIPELKNT